jgi:hypothetical protein
MHYMLLVELPPETRVSDSALDMLHRAMEPFYSDCGGGYRILNEGTDDEEEVYLPQSEWTCGHTGHKWDWWELGGRYVDFFQAVPQPSEPPLRGQSALERFPDIVNGEAQPVPLREGYDLIRKRDVDWEAMAAHKLSKLRGWWAEYEARNQPSSRWMYGVEEGDTLETYVRRRMRDRTYGLLTVSGQWVERETFIYVPDGKSRFEETPEWERLWDQMVASMPDDAVLAIVDYHN